MQPHLAAKEEDHIQEEVDRQCMAEEVLGLEDRRCMAEVDRRCMAEEGSVLGGRRCMDHRRTLVRLLCLACLLLCFHTFKCIVRWPNVWTADVPPTAAVFRWRPADVPSSSHSTASRRHATAVLHGAVCVLRHLRRLSLANHIRQSISLPILPEFRPLQQLRRRLQDRQRALQRHASVHRRSSIPVLIEL